MTNESNSPASPDGRGDAQAWGLALLAKAKAQVAASEQARAEAFDNTFHKIKAEVSRDWWDRIWNMACAWQRCYTISNRDTGGAASGGQGEQILPDAKTWGNEEPEKHREVDVLYVARLLENGYPVKAAAAHLRNMADLSPIQGAPTPPADLRDEELFCPQCNGSGEGRAMTTGHGPDDYEYDCPCQLCGGDGSLLKAFQGMQADRDQFRQKYYAALRGYPEKLLTAQELETLELVIEQFADCGETDVDYAVLLDFAQRGYLECEHFTDTPKARAAITAAKEQTK